MSARWFPLSVMAAAVTAVAYLPELLSTTGEQAAWPFAVNVVVLIAIFTAAPGFVALSRRHAAAPQRIGGLGALLQLPVALLLLLLDVRIEIARGYFTADSGEAAMAYGAGSVVAAVAGLGLALLVWMAARLPASTPAR